MIDKSLYIAMTGASASLRAQASVAQNLANADTVGFQEQLVATKASPVLGQGLSSRVAAVPVMGGVSSAAGQVINTGNELDVALHETALDLLGPEAEVESRWLDGYTFSLSGPIYAGTNEIQRNIVAERILGLPREPKGAQR